jgi:hypothetical protein
MHIIRKYNPENSLQNNDNSMYFYILAGTENINFAGGFSKKHVTVKNFQI